ncbi:phospholipid phosphatase-related protein type 5-like [Channa argus]|uniref:phospholipid phosphatase-related protein type 5-like n=1 Tax=Channa argus TaxID=215402 RepID=UPI00352046DF
MLYFQVVILAATVMLVYYCEFTDTFSPAQQGFICRDPALAKPDPGPEQYSRIQPVILYSVVGGLPVVLIAGVEVVIFLLHHNSNNLYDQEKIFIMGDCCYVNPMVRRTFRFLGVYIFGLFATDIFVNAGQLVTGSLAPYFLSVCLPNYTALSCQDMPHFVSQSNVCTGDPDDIMRARKTFPCKEAALSLYTAIYLAKLSLQMYAMSCIGSAGGRLTGPLLSFSLVNLAVLTGINRVAEYRNHWSDVIAGQAIGGLSAAFLVVFVVQYFRKRPVISPSPSDTGTSDTDEASPQISHTMETCSKYIVTQTPGPVTEVT